MNKLTKRASKLVAGAAAIGAAIVAPLTAFAQGAPAGSALNLLKNSYVSTGSYAGIQTTKQLPELVGSFIQAAIGLLGVILVVLIIYGGFLWMTAQGSEEKIKKAKGIITSCIIGMIIIFAAYAITGFVVNSLITATT